MAAADVERTIDSSVETILNEPVGIFSLQEQTTALKAFALKERCLCCKHVVRLQFFRLSVLIHPLRWYD